MGHCRLNLHGEFDDAADRFLAVWWAVSGETGYDPYWHRPHHYALSDATSLEDFVARAVARL